MFGEKKTTVAFVLKELGWLLEAKGHPGSETVAGLEAVGKGWERPYLSPGTWPRLWFSGGWRNLL